MMPKARKPYRVHCLLQVASLQCCMVLNSCSAFVQQSTATFWPVGAVDGWLVCQQCSRSLNVLVSVVVFNAVFATGA
jgi:hypothetical protein